MSGIKKTLVIGLLSPLLMVGCHIMSQPQSLEESIKAGDVQSVKNFLRQGVSANSKDKNGVPMLLLAIRLGEEEIVKSLLEAGAYVELTDNNGNTPLMIASKENYKNITIDLLEAGANLYAVNNEGKSAMDMLASYVPPDFQYFFTSEMDYIWQSAENYYVAHGMVKPGTLKQQVQNFYDIVCKTAKARKPNDYKVSSLCRPRKMYMDVRVEPGARLEVFSSVPWIVSNAQALNLEKGQTLFRYIVDVNQKTIGAKDKNACVMLDAIRAKALIVKSDKGASINWSEECKFPIELHEESPQDKTRRRQKYRENSKKYTELLSAIRNKNLSEVKHLIHQGVNVNELPIYVGGKDTGNYYECGGCTPLMLASFKGYVPMVELLIKAGAEVNGHSGPWEYNSLILASLWNHPEVVKVLLAAHADVNYTATNGTALSIARNKGHQEIINLLLAAGAH